MIVWFLYALGAAGRLARFNISQESVGNFEGMPTPAAAGFVAALVNLTPRVEPSPFLIGGASLLMLVLGYLMVSSMEFYSLKKLRVSDTTNRVKVLFGVSIALVWYDPALGFMLLALGYALSGPVGQLRVWARGSEPSVVDSDTKEGPSRISEFPKL